jgi:hypothetical protein
MAKNRRGGYRQPDKPAPVATQDRNRTDGGPGSSKQPLRDMPGLPYGQQQQLLRQQQAAPLPAQRPMQIDMNPPKEEVARPNVFAPTERPGESPTAGSPLGDGYTPKVNIDDIDLTLMAMYEVSKSPIILDLINRRS